MKFDWTILATAFGASWVFVAGLLNKVPGLSRVLAVATGPLGAILGPIMSDLNELIVSGVKFVIAYLKMFLDGLTVTAKNLSVVSVIFAGVVGGFYEGIVWNRDHTPPAVCKKVDAAIADIHARFWLTPKR